jgi:hypothetical protein
VLQGLIRAKPRWRCPAQNSGSAVR